MFTMSLRLYCSRCLYGNPLGNRFCPTPITHDPSPDRFIPSLYEGLDRTNRPAKHIPDNLGPAPGAAFHVAPGLLEEIAPGGSFRGDSGDPNGIWGGSRLRSRCGGGGEKEPAAGEEKKIGKYFQQRVRNFNAGKRGAGDSASTSGSGRAPCQVGRAAGSSK